MSNDVPINMLRSVENDYNPTTIVLHHCFCSLLVWARPAMQRHHIDTFGKQSNDLLGRKELSMLKSEEPTKFTK